MGDPVENNFPRCRLSPLNRVLLRVPIQEDVQFRHFGNPTTVDFAVQLNRELHKHSLPLWFGAPDAARWPNISGAARSGEAPAVVDQKNDFLGVCWCDGISHQ